MSIGVRGGVLDVLEVLSKLVLDAQTSSHVGGAVEVLNVGIVEVDEVDATGGFVEVVVGIEVVEDVRAGFPFFYFSRHCECVSFPPAGSLGLSLGKASVLEYSCPAWVEGMSRIYGRRRENQK